MEIKLEFATDGKTTYPLGYVIVAESEEEERTLNVIRDMHFFGAVRYVGKTTSNNNNVKKVMFENPNIIKKCIDGTLKGSICIDHAINITCNRDDFAPKLTFAQFREVMESQLKIID